MAFFKKDDVFEPTAAVFATYENLKGRFNKLNAKKEALEQQK